MIRQKLYGIGLLALTGVVAALTHDITIGVFTIPLGLYLLVSKEYWLND